MKASKKRMKKFIEGIQKVSKKLKLHDGEVIEGVLLVYTTLAMLHGVSRKDALDSVDIMLNTTYDDQERILSKELSKMEEVH